MKITKAFLGKLEKDPQAVLAALTLDEVGQLLQRAADAYYNTSKPLFSDIMFDLVKSYLEERDPSHPALKQIGAPIPAAAENKVTLPYPMASMDKIKDDPAALAKWLRAYPGSYLVSDKLDGISALFLNGRLYTRGDGIVGQDISRFVPSIQSLAGLTVPTDMAVRGELIIPRAGWERIKHLGANPRNVMAGTANAKKPNPEILKEIEFVAYEVVHPSMLVPEEQFRRMAALGFRTAWHQVLPGPEAMTMEGLSKALIARRRESPYEVDGLVIYQNTPHKHAHYKTVADLKNPKYAFAFKTILTQEMAEVTVERVEWNVSKDGLLKPVINFAPVPIGGVTISRATAFNAKYIEDNLIGPGSRLTIIRSGDVIPKIQAVLGPSANGRPALPEDPTQYEWNATHVDILLRATTSAPNREMAIRTLEHFAKTLDITGLGPGNLARLHDAGYVSILKLFTLRTEDVMRLQGFQKRSAEKLVAAIQKAKQTASCEELMVASNLFGRGLGTKKIANIIQALPSILDRKVPTLEELVAIPGISNSTAEPFLQGIGPFFQLLDDIGVPCRKPTGSSVPVPAQQQQTLKDMVIVFTGIRNKDLEAHIAALGGKVAGSVTKKTSLVVAKDPEEETGKAARARELGIRVVSLADFKKEFIL